MRATEMGREKARMRATAHLYILVVKLECKWPFDRPGFRWEDNVKMCLE